MNIGYSFTISETKKKQRVRDDVAYNGGKGEIIMDQ